MGRNILVVEDDRNISDLIQMYLVKEGFDVRIAGDGGRAIEEFQREIPDLILLDIMLPVMDGWAVCAKIRETSKVPIIMLTAKSEVFDRIQGLEMGADDYIVKPFEMKELIARINAVLRRTEIPDDTFASGVLGEGVGVQPTDELVVAPFDGTITSVAESKHAVGIESNGMELLIHVGVDTVAMNGDGFSCLVNDGDTVKAGQPLIRFSREKIKAAGYSDTVAVLLTNSDDMEGVELGAK